MSIAKKPVTLFNIDDSWMREIIVQCAPGNFDVQFIDDPNGDPRESETLASLLERADFLVTVALPKNWIDHLGRCQLVAMQGVGTETVDFEALDQAGIPMTLTPEGTTTGVAEHTILLILALYKRLVEVDASVRRGEFDRISWRKKCHFLSEKTLGIVGFGRIGQRVAHLAQAFDARVIYHDLTPASQETEQDLEASYRDFDALLREADIVSVHTPLTDQTEERFGESEFTAMKQGAIFINTSRGATYNMDALYESLQSDHLGGAGLDVFDPQPPPAAHPILELPQAIFTPYMAAGTIESQQQKVIAQFDNFQRALAGEPLRNEMSSKQPINFTVQTYRR